MLGRTDRRWRMVALLLVFVIFGSASALRLGYWQVVAAPELVARAARTNPVPVEDIPPRAEILDRDGRPLALTMMLDRLVAHPDLIADGDQAAVVDRLGDIMGLGASEARDRYAGRIGSGTRYSILEQRITPEQSLQIRLAMDERELPGIGLDPRQVRVYPEPGGMDDTSLASQLIGFVDAEGRGRYGVEQTYDDRLTGRSDEPLDIASIGELDLGDGLSSPLGVAPIRMTIDTGLQRQLERELAGAKLANDSPRVSAIAMDPYTGAILAWASVPSYDANRFRDEVATWGLNALRDPIASEAYEPGSVMKALTAAAALEHGVVTPQTRIRDAYELKFPGHVVRNADHDSKGILTVKNVVALSRNVAITRVAQRLGKTTDKAARRLYGTWEKLGVVGPTGIDVAAEARGISHDPREKPWAAVDLSNKSFGQGVSVTLLQLAVSYASMMNGGFLVTPYAVEGSEASEQEPVRVLSAKTARQMKDILIHVTGAVSTYARGTLIDRHLVGGKTGTAQFWMPDRGEMSQKVFNYSFIGFVGDDDPKVLIAVRIHETKGKIVDQGNIELNVTSYQLFKRIAKAAIKHLDIKEAKDPDVGYPIPGSYAERVLEPARYARHRRQVASERRSGSRQVGSTRERGRDRAGTRASGTRERKERASRRSAGSGSVGDRAAPAGR